MRTLIRFVSPVVFAVLATCNVGQAAILVDQSPGTWGLTTGSDLTNSQNGFSYADKFSLSSGTQLTGVDIFSSDSYGIAGSAVLIRIWNDIAGQPGSIIQQFNAVISVVDSESAGSETGVVRKHAAFAYAASAGTYWIGMTGLGNIEIGQRSFPLSANITPDGDGQMAAFDGTLGPQGFFPGDMAFRLHGDLVTAVATPEPASLAMWGLGSLGCALAAYRRRKRAA